MRSHLDQEHASVYHVVKEQKPMPHNQDVSSVYQDSSQQMMVHVNDVQQVKSQHYQEQQHVMYAVVVLKLTQHQQDVSIVNQDTLQQKQATVNDVH